MVAALIAGIWAAFVYVVPVLHVAAVAVSSRQ